MAAIPVLLLAGAHLFAAVGAGAQERPGEREPVVVAGAMCEGEEGDPARLASPSASQVEEAEALAAEANQSAILGDDERALELLRRAAGLDPTSASIRYRLGRLLEETREEDLAVSEYCRYLALTPEGPEADEVRDRIDRIAGPFELPAEVAGVNAAEARAREERAAEERAAEQRAAEQRAARERVEEEQAAREQEAREAAERREEEREAAPGADAQEDAAAAGGSSRSGPIRPTPTTVLVTGILLPGMGHVYAGQPETGLVVLGAAAASVAAGLLYRRLEVHCFVVPVDGECPDGQERDRTESRPLLAPGVGVAAAVTIGGAIHAYLQARDRPLGFAGLEPRVEPDGRAVRAGFRVRF
jgi:tetratricopeptide (TPR) repeat protein